MRNCAILSFLVAAALPAAAFVVPQWRISQPIPVAAPFMNDSVNPTGEAFKFTSLLDNNMRRDIDGTIVQADTLGSVSLPEAANSIVVLQTQLRSPKFAKPTLTVKSQAPFKVYLDGKEVASKLSAQRDSLIDASAATAALRLEPEHDVTITVRVLVAESDSIAAPTITATIDGDADYMAGADLPRRFALDDTQYGSRVSGLSMSPDGRYLITNFYNYYSADRWRVYSTLTDLKSGKTINQNLPSGVKWMPDGATLYYTITAADGVDLFEVDPVSGAQTLLAESLPTDRFTFVPGTKKIIYTRHDEGVKEHGPLRRYATPDDRMPGNRSRSWLVEFDPEMGMTRPLTYGSHSTHLYDVSPDGSAIIVGTTRENPRVRPFYEQTLYQLNLATLKADTLVAPSPQFVNNAVYSPDGSRILFTGSPAAFNGLGKNCDPHPIANDYDTQAYIMDIASRKVTPMSREFDPNIDGIICWNRANGLIYLIGEEGFGKTLWSLNPTDGKYTRLPQEVSLVNAASMGDDSALRLAYMGQGYEYSGKAYILDLKSGRSTLLADPRGPELAKINLGKVDPWRFTASDGTEIDGVICYPPDFDPNKKYPLIVYYYGGTSPTQRSITQPYTPQLFASRDYVVYVVNPSGTTGYGQEFSARHVNAWGKRTAQDIIEGVERFCKAHPFVDSSKIGCLGASYGGFMTQYLQTLTPMFAAAVSHAGISNVTSYWGEGYWGYSYNSVAAADSYPWSDPELFTKQGSLFNADKINTPLLLLHGTADTNVPIGESIQLFNALRILGKDVEFISVDGENHFIADYPKRIQWQNSIMAWFEKWLKGDSAWWDDLYPHREM